MRILFFVFILIIGCTPTVPDKPHKVYTVEQPNNKLQASNQKMENQARDNRFVFTGIPTKDSVVYLTFDDGPGKYTPQILDILEQYNVKATFFMCGLAIKNNPKTAQAVAKAGHLIGNHTFDHTHLGALPLQEVRREIDMAEDAARIAKIEIAPIARAPWGYISDIQVDEVVALGYNRVYHWSINTDDWKYNNMTDGAELIFRTVVDNLHPGVIILMHDAGGKTRQETVDALGPIMAYLLENGWKCETLPVEVP